MHRWKLIVPEPHSEFERNRPSPLQSCREGNTFITPHAARAMVVTRVNLHWPHTGLEGWGYPAKKTARQSDIQFQRYKLLKSVSGSGRAGLGRAYSDFSLNPRPGGGLSHLRHGGRGGQNDPPLTRKLGKLEGRAIRQSTALSEPVRSHFGHFFAQVNIEVSRGHQRSNFRKMMVYQECRPLSREL